MKMLIGCITGVLLAVTALADTSVILSTGSLTSPDNNVWNNGLPSLANPGTIGIIGTFQVGATMNGWDVTQTAGTVERTSSSNIQLEGNTTWRISNGVIQQTGGGHLRVGSSSSAATMIMTGGELIATAGRFDVSYQSFLDISGGSISSGTLFNFTGGGNAEVSGTASMTADTMAVGASGGFLLDISGGTIVITNALTVANRSDAVIRFNAGNGDLSVGSINLSGTSGYFDFVDGSEGSFTVDGYTAADFEQMWDDGTLKVDGDNIGVFSELFSVDGSKLEMVPEPATVSMFLLSGLGLMFYRRVLSS